MTSIIDILDIHSIQWVSIPCVKPAKGGKFITRGAPCGYTEFTSEEETLEFRALTLNPNCFVCLYLTMGDGEYVVIRTKTNKPINTKFKNLLLKNNCQTMCFESFGDSYYFIQLYHDNGSSEFPNLTKDEMKNLETIYSTDDGEIEICYSKLIYIPCDAKSDVKYTTNIEINEFNKLIEELLEGGDDEEPEEPEKEHIIDNIRPQDSVSNVGDDTASVKDDTKTDIVKTTTGSVCNSIYSNNLRVLTKLDCETQYTADEIWEAFQKSHEYYNAMHTTGPKYNRVLSDDKHEVVCTMNYACPCCKNDDGKNNTIRHKDGAKIRLTVRMGTITLHCDESTDKPFFAGAMSILQECIPIRYFSCNEKRGMGHVGIMRLYSETYGGNIAYVDNHWYIFNGKFWERNTVDGIPPYILNTLTGEFTRSYIRSYNHFYNMEMNAGGEYSEHYKAARDYALKLEDINYVETICKGLRSIKGCNIKFDSDNLLFKYGDKVANIKTGEIREPRKEDYITIKPESDIFDSLKSYLFDVANKAEGKPIDKLASEFLLKKNDPQEELANMMLNKFVIGAVCRVFVPGCKFDYSPILHGGQGLGKSTFFNSLAGGTPYFCDSLNADTSNKDTLMILHSAWIHEWSEIEHITSKKEAGDVKAFLTKTDDKFRTPYDVKDKSHLRRCVIVGTTNQKEFLIDDSGDRRFWVISCSVEKIDIDKLREWRDGIWASAVLAWRRGETAYFEKEIEDRIKQSNSQFRTECPWFNAVSDYIRRQEEIRKQDNKEVFFRTDLILEGALEKPTATHTRTDTLKIANIMRKLGYELKNIKSEGKCITRWVKNK